MKADCKVWNGYRVRFDLGSTEYLIASSEVRDFFFGGARLGANFTSLHVLATNGLVADETNQIFCMVSWS